MAAPVPYVTFPGTARDALAHDADVFGGDVEVHTLGEFGRTDGPEASVAHGVLDGPVALFATDAGDGELPVCVEGIVFALLGTADPDVLRRWFDRLADGGTVLDPLAERPWGATDGQVRDRFGLTWLIGFEPGERG